MFYALSVTLQNRKPLNQRVFQISDNLTFMQLAQTICNLYGLSGDHLREFRKEDLLVINHPDFSIPEVSTQDFSDPEFDDLQGTAQNLSSRSYKLSDYFSHDTNIEFIYDFGETWKFDIKLSKADQDDQREGGNVVTILS